MEVSKSAHGSTLVHPDTCTPTNGISRDADVWLSDGNCVVIANNAAFRVYKGVLSLHSDVFRDLFSLPNSSGSDTMDGCPVVTVTDDVHDIRCLFLVLCCGKDFYHENDEPKPVEFATLASLIRMGHKYAIPKIMNEALCRLKKHYPTSLSTWDDATAREGYVITEPIDAFEVSVRRAKTPSLLPSAFFECCESMYVFNCRQRRPSPRRRPASPPRAFRPGRAAPDKGTGEPRSVRRPTDSHTRRKILQPILRLSLLSSGMRRQSRVTARFNQRTLEGSFFKNTRYHAALRPLCEWFFVNPTETAGLVGLQCEGCLNFLKRTDEKLRADAWALLPEVFDLHVNGWPSTTV